VTGNTVVYYLQHSCVFNDDRHLTYTYTYVPTMYVCSLVLGDR